VEKVSAAFPTNEKPILMMPFMPGMWRIHGWSDWCQSLVVDKWKVSGFQTQEDTGSYLAWGPTKPAMGGRKDSCNGTRHSAIEHFCIESEAYKICEGWATGEGNKAFPTNALRRNES
jgi:hypothetical protein